MIHSNHICQFCSSTYDLIYHEEGFWCEECDGFTYYDHINDNHQFNLIFEEKHLKNGKQLSSSASKFKKQLSPLRYPGGKSKVIDYLYTFLQKHKSYTLISPFTGGGSFELAMLEAGVVKELKLNDIDTGVFSFWWVVLHFPFTLIDRIRKIKLSHEYFYKAQSIIKKDYQEVDMIDAAWSFFIVNRLAYSGIVKSGPLGGKSGNEEKLLSRWNAEKLIQKILYIHSLRDYITISQENAVDLIEDAYWQNDATIFIDPPYFQKGKFLYHCYYDERQHIELSVLLDSLFHGVPGANILVTYDYNKRVEDLYRFPIIQTIGRQYSA